MGEIYSFMENIVFKLIEFMQYLGPASGIILVTIESFIPMLPLGVFVAFNIASFGYLLGFIMSWLATVLGCFLVFLIIRHIIKDKLEPFLNKRPKYKKTIEQIEKLKSKLDKISFSGLVIMIAMPFLPSFLINISAGLSNISKRKFAIALLTGKIFMIYFWAYIGKSLTESIVDIYTILRIGTLMLAAYILSKIVDKFLNKEENK